MQQFDIMKICLQVLRSDLRDDLQRYVDMNCSSWQ